MPQHGSVAQWRLTLAQEQLDWREAAQPRFECVVFDCEGGGGVALPGANRWTWRAVSQVSGTIEQPLHAVEHGWVREVRRHT